MRLNVTVDGRTYEVDVEVSEPERRPVPPMPTGKVRLPAGPAVAPVAPAAGANGTESVADEAKVCRSPVTGVVSQVIVQPGQAMQVDDVLLVLEAMKMETRITAPVAAKISKVNVAAGDAVKSGQVLIEFD